MTQDHHEDEAERVPEIAIVGDLTEHESELTERLLDVPPGGECTLYFDSPGGSPYCAMSLMTLIRLRGLRATGIVTGECSSAALWPFAACERRFVTAYSILLFHPMKWQSEENVGSGRSSRVGSTLWPTRKRHGRDACRLVRRLPRIDERLDQPGVLRLRLEIGGRGPGRVDLGIRSHQFTQCHRLAHQRHTG